jgi:glycosyltransferase involved in cell wall biosynthesis
VKRVLIYLHEDELAPVGGPKGYNFNLLQGLKKLGLIETPDTVCFCFLQGKSVAVGINDKIKNMRNKKLQLAAKAAKSIYKKGKMMYGHKHMAEVDLTEYDAVHFHLTMDLYWAKDSLKNYKGKVLLTSHTPTTPAKEIYSLLTDFEKKYMKWFYRKLPEIDEFAFNRADYIIFPCLEAEEPYYHEWSDYAKIHERNKEKYWYLPTGTGEKDALFSKKEIREKYGIPQDAFVISYVGRHNEIKGYSTLKIIGSEILDKYKNVYFLIAGKEGPVSRLENERWIEVGWTNDPGSVIQAADLFILPNKETYFDLIMLEVLSLGQLILATKTGGNKYFTQFHAKGISLYYGVEEAVTEIQKFMKMTDDERAVLRKENRSIYLGNFTNTAFAQNYSATIKKILE